MKFMRESNTSENLSTIEQTAIEQEEKQCVADVESAQKNESLKLEAHPGEKLLAHCLQVGYYARKLIQEKQLRLPEGLSKDAFEKLTFLSGACHDFGKATNQFQKYLKATDWREKREYKLNPLTRHALLGAVVAYAMLTESDLDKELKATPIGRVLRLVPFWIIRRHHGNLLDAQTDLTPAKKDFENLSKQLDDCPPDEFDFILDQIMEKCGLIKKSPITHAWMKAELENTLFDIGSDQLYFKTFGLNQLPKEDSLAPWLLLQQLFSVLLDADKSYAAIEIRKPVNDYGLKPDWITQYRNKNFKSASEGVNKWRAEVSQIAADTIETAPIDTPFFQLTLPTGLGKTLTAFDCTLRLRERLHTVSPQKRTIIYALPFLSILEQTAGVYDELFADALECAAPSELMIRHHHLAELRYVKGEASEANDNTLDEREFNPNQSQLMIEGWRSALIMTSTVQLFQSLFSGRNRTTRKLHRLAGAIVVLDEVQSIPFKYWSLMNKVMRALNHLFDTRFILVTATQPRFLETVNETNKVVELVLSYKTYFDRLDRTVTSFDLVPRTIECFAEIVRTKMLEEHNGQNALIIVNTVNAAIELFNLLKAQLEKTHDVLHLSTNIVPHERARRIESIKRRQNNERPLIVVSTQLVEAGVDLSFPVLFRDFAPFSAIVQAAGRANRSGEFSSRGQVYIYKLIDARNKEFAKFVYRDFIELNATEDVLKEMQNDGFAELTEENLIVGVERYFTKIQPQMPQESHQVLLGAKSLTFRQKSSSQKDALETFQLIEDEDKDAQQVFIELNEQAKTAWYNYDQLLNRPFVYNQTLEESFIHAGKLRDARIKCLPFMLSVQQKYFTDNERAAKRKDEIAYYPKDEIENIYSLETGWLRI